MTFSKTIRLATKGFSSITDMTDTIEAIINAAKTGEIGDGRIFVSDVADTFRIRTGESGPDTLYEK